MKTTIVLAMILALAGAPAAAEILDREFPARSGGRIEFDLETGASITVTGWDRDAVSVHADLSGRDRDDAEVAIEPASGGVVIRSRFGETHGSHSTNFSFDVRVPRRFDVQVGSSGGGVTIIDVEGRFAGKTAGGNLTFRRAEGQVELRTLGGNLNLEDSRLDGSISTNGGNISLSGVEGDLEMKTMGGNVTLEEVSGGVKTSTMGGNVKYVGSQGGAADPVRLHTMGGQIEVVRAPGGADLHTMGGNIVVSSAGDFVEAETMGGDIRIDDLTGGLKATTMGGDVTVRLVGEPSGSQKDIEIVSMSGDVDLTVPSGFSMSVEIDLAYTKNSRQDYAIESDLALQITRTAEWERDGESTPRKHIYGRGVFGGGAHQVKIRTINGDVHLKQGVD